MRCRWAFLAVALSACATSSPPQGPANLSGGPVGGGGGDLFGVDLYGTGGDDLGSGGDQGGGSDQGVGHDLAVATDLAGVSDLAVPSNLSLPSDLSTAIADLATNADLAVAADLSTPADLATNADMAGPCSILTQNCTGGLKCVASYDSTNNKEKGACVTAGTKTQGQSCTTAGSGDTCAAGYVCLGSKCYKYCGVCNPSNLLNPCNAGTADSETATYCNPTGATPTYCVDDETIGTTPAHVVAALCDTGCDIKNSPKSCTNPSNGMTGACYLVAGGPICISPAGTTADGQMCSGVGDCVGGDSCFGSIIVSDCSQTCIVGGPSSQCSGGKSCANLADPAVPGLGVCN